MMEKETAPAASGNAAKGPKSKSTDEKRIHSSTRKNKAPVEPICAPQALAWASPFRFGEDGIYKVDFDEKSQSETTVWVFSPLVVEARTRDLDEQNWGFLLRIQTPCLS